MTEPVAISEMAEQLRQAFDRTFAVPARTPQENLEEFLAVGIAGRPFAFRLRELARIESNRRIVPIPSANADLLGLMGSQGRLIPVYHLAGLLGIQASGTVGPWVAICSIGEPLGLAFEALDGHLRISSSEILDAGPVSASTDWSKQTIQQGGSIRSIIALPAVLEIIRRRIGSSLVAKKEP